jgi:hypothetical protein
MKVAVGESVCTPFFSDTSIRAGPSNARLDPFPERWQHPPAVSKMLLSLALRSNLLMVVSAHRIANVTCKHIDSCYQPKTSGSPESPIQTYSSP